jgi:predicted membrane protein
VVSNARGTWDASAKVGPWAVGGPTPQWGIFFALWCGLNYRVLVCIQCWPFSRIRQPWGGTLAVLGVIGWAALLARVAAAIFDAAFADHATALLEAQVWGWHTVFWGFCFALLYGVGSTPYLWAGQRTPGTWEDVDRSARTKEVGRDEG